MSLGDRGNANGITAAIVAHQRRITELRSLANAAEREAELHLLLVQLARDERLVAVAHAYAAHLLHDESAADFNDFCTREHFDLPRQISEVSYDREAGYLRIFANVRTEYSGIRIIWDESTGTFRTKPLDEPDRRLLLAGLPYPEHSFTEE